MDSFHKCIINVKIVFFGNFVTLKPYSPVNNVVIEITNIFHSIYCTLIYKYARVSFN